MKFLFIFREEYLAKLTALVPELRSAVPFRLPMIVPDNFARIVSGPFREKAPFSSSPIAPLFRENAAKIGGAFQQRGAGVGQNILTEIQVYCRELWLSPKLHSSLSGDVIGMQEHIDDVLTSCFQRVIDALGRQRAVALALLCEMVTLDKTRNVVSEASLLQDFAIEKGNPKEGEQRHSTSNLKEVLFALETGRIINQSDRNGAIFYDLASESLIPWLSEERRKRIEAVEHAQQKKALQQKRQKQRFFAAIAALCICAGLLGWALYERSNAKAKEAFALTETAKALQEKERADEQAKRADEQAKRADREAKANLEAEAKARQAAEEALAAASEARQAEQLASAKAVEAERRAAQAEDGLKLVQKTLKGVGVTAAEIQETTDKLIDPLVARLTGHDDAVTCATFSRDGKWIVTGSADKKVRLWTAGGKLVNSQIASESAGGVSAVVFTPDSAGLITGSSGQSIRLFPLRDGRLATGKEFDFHGDTVTFMEFSADGGLGVCAFGDGTAKLVKWSEPRAFSGKGSRRPAPDAVDPELLTTWTHTARRKVTAARFSADGKRVVTSSDDGMVRVFSTEAPFALVRDDTVGNPMDVKSPTRGFCFSPKDTSLVVGGAGAKKVVWWKIGSGLPSKWRDSAEAGPVFHEGAVLGIAFNPTGKWFASFATDGLCIVWDSTNAKSIVQVPTEIKGRLLSCDWNGELLALAGEDGWVELWDTSPLPRQPTRVFSTNAHQGPVWGVRFSPGGDLLLTWGQFQSEGMPDPKGKAVQLSRQTPPRSDTTAALWDISRCRKKGWARRP